VIGFLDFPISLIDGERESGRMGEELGEVKWRINMLEDKKISVIGTGQMGGALIRGIVKAGLVAPEMVFACDVVPEILERLHKEAGVKTTREIKEAVKNADVVLIAVKPQQIDEFTSEVTSVGIKDSHLFISIAGGITTGYLEEKLGGTARVIRVMPNLACNVGEAASVYTLGKKARKDDVSIVEAIFGAVGIVFNMEERFMDAVTGLSGSGPAYVAMVIEALADGGVKMGLSRDVALALAAQTAVGAGKLILEGKLHPGQLKDMVSSPGGTTIQGVSALEKGGLRTALIEAVEAATKRSIELGKK
jgi:pyrroline-5-carboxylate reductase